MTYEEIVALWNSKADRSNQWFHLGEAEKIEFAYRVGLDDGGEG